MLQGEPFLLSSTPIPHHFDYAFMNTTHSNTQFRVKFLHEHTTMCKHKETHKHLSFYHMFCSKQCTTFEPLELLAQVLFQMVFVMNNKQHLSFYLLEDGRLKQSFDCIEY
jgi:hypothetical protein